MARQSTTPVQFNRSTRQDRAVGMTSGRAGEVIPVSYIPVLRGDSMSGGFTCSVDLAEMPKPLLNAVGLNVQAWFVPFSAFPWFSGYDEFMMSWNGATIETLGATDREPPVFCPGLGTGATMLDGDIFDKLGIHAWTDAVNKNSFIQDAYNLIWNFRASAHSTKITRRPYTQQDYAAAATLAPAFWPTGKHVHMVPDYEAALVTGLLDLDITSGRVPVSGIGYTTAVDTSHYALQHMKVTPGETITTDDWGPATASGQHPMLREDPFNVGFPGVFAEMANEPIESSLAAIDKARQTQAFARLRATMAGSNFSGFETDDAIVAELMQGFRVPELLYQRPWLLDSKRVGFGMMERHAMDGANLDSSVTVGAASARLSLNLPQQETGGVVIITAEVLPEQLHERQGDPFVELTEPSDFPDALRDIQNPEPVDQVPNWRIDTAHTTPEGLYAYEPMNAKWDRNFTRLGGKFRQENPAVPFTEARAAIWNPEVVNPVFNTDHYVAPADFPHDVFSDTLADAFEISFQHAVSLRGLTQIGDVLVEDNSEYGLTVLDQE